MNLKGIHETQRIMGEPDLDKGDCFLYTGENRIADSFFTKDNHGESAHPGEGSDKERRNKRIMNQEIYVDVGHLDFWWGIYAFTHATSWEDLIFYEKKADDFVCIGAVCVCSRRYLENGLAALEDDPLEKDFVEEIKQFLQSRALTYRYWYDERGDENFHEVAFEAERNGKGVKPSYIEMWYPGDGIDMQAAETCTVAFCAKFLNKQVDIVHLKDVPPFEQTADEYRKHMARFSDGPVQIAFTDELVEALEKQWKLPREDVRKILLRSVPGRDGTDS